MSHDPAPSFIGRQIGSYKIEAVLGSDDLYRARDTRLRRTVAVKILPQGGAADPVLRHRFEREARAIAALRHPHICVLHDIGHAEGVDFLVMEYLEGVTLAERLREGPLTLDQVFGYAIEIAGALDETHRSGVVHRNLKPGNIMLTTSGTKLLDFGLATLGSVGSPFDGSAGEFPETGPAALSGGSRYSAPEQLERRQVDGRADLFAFGAILYEMITGMMPFEADSEAGIVAAILNRDPPSMVTIRPQVSPALDHTVRRCLVKDPDGRWQTAHDLLEELKWAAETSQVTLVTPPAARPARRFHMAGWVLAGILATTAISAFLALSGRVASIFEERGPGDVDRPLTFAEPLPENVTLASAVGQSIPAVSPDGRSLAFVGRQAGETRLWIRSFDSPEAQPLPGTDNASFPFWSPDGRAVGFFEDLTLKVVDVASGSVRSVCQPCIATPRGATWTSAGMILYGGNFGSGLSQVAAIGGAPTRVTGLGDAVSHRFPTFLPDGRLLYLSTPSNTIWIASLTDGTAAPLVQADSQALYVAPGWLLFTREGTLLAQRFDMNRGTVSADPVPIAKNILKDPSGGAAFSVSPSGVLAYRTDPHNGMTQFTWVDRGGRSLGAAGAPGFYRNPALSPDGSHVAVQVTNTQNRTQDIWLMNLESGGAARLISDEANEAYPLWSPDGHSIIFASDRGADRVYSLYQKRVDGTEDEKLAWAPPASVMPFSWSPKGDALVYADALSARLAVLSLGPERTARALDSESGPVQVQGQVSPDGQWIAYNDFSTRRHEVYVQRFPTAGTSRTRVSPNGGGYVRWRRDGKELVYYRLDGQLVSVEVTPTAAGLKLGTEVPLFEAVMLNGPVFTQGFRAQYDIAPDGQRFLLNTLLPAAPSFTVVLNWSPARPK